MPKAIIGNEVNFTSHLISFLFTYKDTEDILSPHDHALVMALKVTIGKVARTL